MCLLSLESKETAPAFVTAGVFIFSSISHTNEDIMAIVNPLRDTLEGLLGRFQTGTCLWPTAEKRHGWQFLADGREVKLTCLTGIRKRGSHTWQETVAVFSAESDDGSIFDCHADSALPAPSAAALVRKSDEGVRELVLLELVSFGDGKTVFRSIGTTARYRPIF